MTILAQHAWVEEFQRHHGRAPRVLHVGNIANNAYNNAKVLNAAGVESHVLCYDYYHLMGSPEWEDADFEGCPANHYRPDWTTVDLHGFTRPRWYVQGPLALGVEYLTALCQGDSTRCELLWARLTRLNGTGCTPPVRPGLLDRVRTRVRGAWDRLRGLALMRQPLHMVAQWMQVRAPTPGWRESGALFAIGLMLLPLSVLRLLARPKASTWSAPIAPEHLQISEAMFGRTGDQLQADFVSLLPRIDMWRRLFSHYDLVQGYATDPVWPYLAKFRPYVAFEHGTLRELTGGRNSLDRAAALAYMAADHVFVTNGDCLEHARKLGITAFSPVLHPLNTPMFARAKVEEGWAQTRYGATRVFLCPVRHDWAIKGTDVHIRAMPLIRDRIGDDFCVVFVRWGEEVGRSVRLIEALGVGANARWIDPIAHHSLARHMGACDAVFDQVKFPTFGGIAPEALATGVPVIMSYDPKVTEWIVDRPAPVLAAWTPEDVARHAVTAVSTGFRERYAAEARKWVEECHSLQHVVDSHLHVYSSLIGTGSPSR